MKESTHVFGPHRHLLGTITAPASAASASGAASTSATASTANDAVGCLLMSAGVVHRTGPHRINVKLARALAEQGVPSLRVDLAAVGDSRTPPTDTAYDKQAVIDLRAGIDLLASTAGVRSVIMVGLCSGAVYSLRTALVDERVSGLFLIDGYAFPTARSHRERYLQKARTLTPGALGRSLRNRLQRSPEPPAPTSAPDYGLSHPPLADYARDLRSLLARGVSIRQLYTGSILQFYNYQNQFVEAFADYPDLQAIPTEYQPAIDHTMTSLEAQQALLDRVLGWHYDMRRATGASQATR